MAKNQHARKNLWKNPTSNDSLSKSAKIILSKSLLEVKKESNFFKKKSKNINLGDHYLSKTFFSKLNFWTTLQITPNFWQTVITCRNFLKIFPWWHVESWPKSLLLIIHHLWNSTTELILTTNTSRLFFFDKSFPIWFWLLTFFMTLIPENERELTMCICTLSLS